MNCDALRPVEMIPGFHRTSEGSVLYRAGGTIVLCTASVDEKVPPFLEGKGQGWVTAEYQMHPRANPKKRENRDGRGLASDEGDVLSDEYARSRCTALLCTALLW